LTHKKLNLGILAHVDAGKTTLTERLLYAAGAIDTLGSVDEGTTQTDSLALERERGITIKAAVVSFPLGELTVNLIDTPGHPDFIAEVERALGVLDGAVLVISAVEGVQAQTRLLMRALQRLRVPTLLFVNKIDRVGASDERVVEAISKRLTATVVPLSSVREIGTRAVDVEPLGESDPAFVSGLAASLADRSDAILAAYVAAPESVPYRRLRRELAKQTKRALVHPLYFGSALTGAGIEPLMSGVAHLLPSARGDAEGPVSGTVFKVERGSAAEKVAYVRMFSGTIRNRDRLRLGAHSGADEAGDGRVTAISVFESGSARRRASVSAGEIAKLWGLKKVRVGDAVGIPPPHGLAPDGQFAPPTLETVVVANRPENKPRLRVALGQLAEQDPLINVRTDSRNDISVSLFGEVQKEVVQATLASDYGIGVTFREVTPICVERPIAAGGALEILHAESNPFLATIGLRVEPGCRDSGVELRLDVDPRTIPLYIYKTIENFTKHLDEWVRLTLDEGLFGWRVTDCRVTMTRCTYSIPDGPPSRRGPPSTPADFRHLAPLVLMQALDAAGTVVCEPMLRVTVEVPSGSVGAAIPALARLGAEIEASTTETDLSVIEAILPAGKASQLQGLLRELTSGEGVFESSFAGYEPVSGQRPARQRTTVSPLDRQRYLASVAKGSRYPDRPEES
jgi:ribosomal protection tetracycline resistance protein